MSGHDLIHRGTIWREAGPVVLSLGGIIVLGAVGLRAMLAATDGRLVYPFDDTYIHMAIARCLVNHGVWGVGPHEFAGCSSSPLWTLLVAGGFWLGGPRDWLPLLFSALAAIGLVVLADRELRRAGAGAGLRLAALTAITVLAPLPVLLAIGMEHVLHALLSVAMVALCARTLRAADGAEPRVGLAVVAALLVATRYEGLFLAVVLAVVLVIGQRRAAAAVVACASAVPAIAYAVFSVAHGGFILPNSVWMKAMPTRQVYHLLQSGPLTRQFWEDGAALMGGQAGRQLLTSPHLLATMAALVAAVVLAWRTSGRARLLAPAVMVTMLLHLQYARTVRLHRYEGYLVVLGLFTAALVIAPAKARTQRARVVAGLLGLFVLYALHEAGNTFRLLPRAARNVHDQQYQMARFVGRFYPGAAVALNDIGAVSYFADIQCLDIWGMASQEIARSRLTRTRTAELLAGVARRRGVRIAIVCDEWLAFYGGEQSGWTRVGRWTITANFVRASDAVCFYACSPAEVPRLASCLRAFAPELPPGDTQHVVLSERTPDATAPESAAGH